MLCKEGVSSSVAWMGVLGTSFLSTGEDFVGVALLSCLVPFCLIVGVTLVGVASISSTATGLPVDSDFPLGDNWVRVTTAGGGGGAGGSGCSCGPRCGPSPSLCLGGAGAGGVAFLSGLLSGLHSCLWLLSVIKRVLNILTCSWLYGKTREKEITIYIPTSSE